MKVTLDVPDHVNFQIVYRLERARSVLCEWPDGFHFVLLRSWKDGLKRFPQLTKCLGLIGACTAAAKLATPSRDLYLVMQGNRVVSFGWASNDRCKHYKMEPGSVVIGPIWSDPDCRGKGLATLALQAAINEYVQCGRSLFYIDTSKENSSAQRVFAKSGFGEPVALYFR
jgi:ribosomal protein S18 acetylase RimI-like enzyme